MSLQHFNLLHGGTGRFVYYYFLLQGGLNQEGGVDVYNFLHMVRGSANGEESNTACLGVEVDELVLEDDYAEWEPSPEHNSSFDKPCFEDSAEFENSLDYQPGESTWEKVSASNLGSSGGGWDVDKNAGTTTGNGDVWSSWGRDKAEKQDVPSLKPQEDSSGSGGWDAAPAWGTSKKAEKQSVPSLKPPEDSSGSGGWDAVAAWGSDKKSEKQDVPLLKPQEDSSGSGGWDAVAAWGTGKKAEKQDVPSLKPQEDSSGSGGWDGVAAWGTGEKRTTNDSVSSGWGTRKTEQRDIISTKAQEDSFRSDGQDVAASWEKRTAAKSESSGWGTKKAEAGDVISSKNVSSGWGMGQGRS